MSEGATDLELVARARSGDKDAFGELATRHRANVDRLARRMVGDNDLAHDLTQETILHAYLSLDRLRDNTRFASWLYGITLNVCRSHLRDQRASLYSYEAIIGGLRFEAGAFAGALADPQELAETHELQEKVLAAVQSLSPENRAATVMFYFDGLSVQEIAEALGISRAAVKGRLFKSRKRLHAEMFELYQEPMQRARRQTMVLVKVADVVKRENPLPDGHIVTHHIVVLYDEAGGRALPLWVGPFEGLAIALGVMGESTPRPMTFAFIAKLLDAAKVTVESVEVQALKEDVYYGAVRLTTNGATTQVDARPSDAIALALYTGCPISVADELFQRGGMSVPALSRQRDQPPAGIDMLLQEFTNEYQAIRKAAPPTEAELDRSRQELITLVFGRGN